MLNTSIALLTLDEAKAYLKVDSDTGDAMLGILINATSQWVKNYLNRNFVSTSHTEYYNGDGSDILMLKNIPIVSVTTIHDDTDRVYGSDTLVSATNYIVMKESGFIKAWDLYGSWTPGTANIKAVYTAGYTTGDAGTMPYDLRLAVLRILDHQWRQGFTHRRLDVSSESIGDQTTTFRNDGMPVDALKILEQYRRVLDTPQFSHAG